MFTNFVESLLRNVGANTLTDVFIIIMFGVFVLALIMNSKGEWSTFTSYTATLLTSLGILGTFAGVVTGLLDFDSSKDQIDTSIALLLNGLKTAFISSLVGMFLSIVYKVLVLTPHFRKAESGGSETGVTIETLYEVEKEQSKYLHAVATAMAGREGKSVLKQLAQVCESLEQMQDQMERSQAGQKLDNEEQLKVMQRTLNVLSDDGESSLTGQLKLTRSDANDIGNKITVELGKSLALMDSQFHIGTQRHADQKVVWESAIQKLDEVRLDAVSRAADASEQRSSMVALLERSPTETLIAALEDVIRDFNKHISEQFGENFKELNVAVGRMINWQENYRGQIEELQRAFDISAQSISKCEQSISTIEQSSAAIPDHMSTLDEVLRISRHQLNDLDAHLEAFSDVKQRAVESVPALHGIVENVVVNIADSTTKMIDSCESSNRNFVQAMTTSVNDLKESSNQVNVQLSATAQRLNGELTVMLNGLRLSIEEQFKNSSDSVERLIDKEFKDMEDVRRAQVQNIMQEMGEALTSITGQFTRDYGSLVGAMKSVVEESRRRGI